MTGPVAHREKVHDDIDGLAFVALEAVHQPGERGQRVGVQGHVPQWEPVIASQDQLSSRPALRDAEFAFSYCARISSSSTVWSSCWVGWRIGGRGAAASREGPGAAGLPVGVAIVPRAEAGRSST